jgi:hypothetical protein
VNFITFVHKILEKKMRNYRVPLALCVMACLLAGASATSSQEKSQTAATEKTLWDMERAYWHYVQDNDLRAYRAQWHENFIGWPSVSAAPVNKAHITDWITAQTSNALAFKAGEFKPASIKVTGNIAVTYYWMTYSWTDKNGNGDSHTARVTHTWLKEGNEWRIIGGMSMLEPATP